MTDISSHRFRLALTITFALGFAIFNCASVFAWNDVGHMVVAGIAYRKLQAPVKARADALLKLNPYYQTWLQKLPQKASDEDRKMMIFMLAATWPDAIKGDSSYVSDGANGGHKPESASASQNIGYSDHLMHKYWHFVDYPFSIDGSSLQAVPTPNAETQISEFCKILSSDSSDSLKSYDLTWLLHLLGDIHQPLHCVTRVAASHPHGDNGGNSVKIHAGAEDSNLHAYWDNILGLDSRPEKVLRLVKKLSPPAPAAARDADKSGQLRNWIAEGENLARTDVYVRPVGADNGPYTLDRFYQKRAQSLAKRQMRKGGLRLACLLNANLN